MIGWIYIRHVFNTIPNTRVSIIAIGGDGTYSSSTPRFSLVADTNEVVGEGLDDGCGLAGLGGLGVLGDEDGLLGLDEDGAVGLGGG